MYWRLFFSVILLGVLIFVVQKAVNIKDLEDIIFNFPKEQLVFFLVLSFLIIVLKAWRFFVLLRNVDLRVSFFETVKAFIASQTASPLPGGEALRGILIHKETGANVKETAGPVITQAYLELISAALLALIGSLYFSILRVPIIIVIIVLSFLSLLLLSKRFLNFISSKLPGKKFIKNILRKLKFAQAGIRENVFDKDQTFVKSLSLSLLSHFMAGILIFWIAKSYGINLNIFQSIFIAATSVLISTIASISPGGLGFTEGGMTGILLVFNVDLARALGIVLIFRFVTLVFSIVLGAVFLTIFYGKGLLLKK